ncbi:MAG: 3-oxoacyl-ACP reductase FabG [Acidobacteriia bacterium]|nr:3-oxoacyl-ACP reductase FabG [Terriglobia bacterium]
MIETGLRQKVVLVTGGAAGIGRATALRFAQEDCRVAVWDVRQSGVPQLLEELEVAGGEALFEQVDVSDSAAVESAIAKIVKRWFRIDVLVNNAGIVRDSQLVKWKDGAVAATMSEEQFDDVIAVNLKGVFVSTRAVVPHMIRQGGGVILNASSIVGLHGNFGQTNYASTKAGVIAMTQTWARELGRYKIRVNAVAPGFIATEMVKSMPPKVIESMVGHTPLGRTGEPRDIAEAYVWLASDAAAFVHGAVLSIDGGIVLGT